MTESAIGPLLSRLYELCLSKTTSREGNRIAEGHKFEDETAQEIYQFALESGFEPNPPRTTLNLPTLSGNVHQFDASFRDSHNEVYVIECKNTREAAMDYVYFFNAKIMDYLHASQTDHGLSIRGIFLSTVPVTDNAWRYGIAYGVRVVDPNSPPPEYVICNNTDSTLCQCFEDIIEKMEEICQGNQRLHQASSIRRIPILMWEMERRSIISFSLGQYQWFADSNIWKHF